jgi:hypothetical protein
MTLSKKAESLIASAGATVLNHSDATYVQFSTRRTSAQLALLDQAFALEPALWLRTYGWGTLGGVEFLEELPSVRGVFIDHTPVADWSGLAGLSRKIEGLSITATKAKIPLGEIASRPTLRKLRLLGPARPRDYAELGRLSGLEELLFQKAKLDDAACEALGKLTKLTSLRLQFCEVADFGFLEQLPSLRELSVTKGKGLNALSQLSRLTRLRSLSLSSLPITSLDGLEALSSLESLSVGFVSDVDRIDPIGKLNKLSSLSLFSMKKLSSLAPIARAKAVTRLSVTACNHLKVDDFEPLVGHPALTELRLGLGSLRKHEAITALLGL